MGESLSETHIDNDNVTLKGKNNDIDIVPSISEYKLLSYEHLGSEFQHLEDVAVLCTDCHLKLHGIKGGYEQK